MMDDDDDDDAFGPKWVNSQDRDKPSNMHVADSIQQVPHDSLM